MPNLKELFEERSRLYYEKTDLILQSMPHVIEGVLLALEEDAGSSIVWEDAQLAPEDDVIVLIGFIQLIPGENIVLDTGKTISITEDNAESFRRILRVGIPLDLVENGSVEEITEYFIQRKDKNYENVEEIVESIDNIETQAVASITGFDMDELSEDQIRQVMQHLDKDKIH
jgi:hypothetical protein